MMDDSGTAHYTLHQFVPLLGEIFEIIAETSIPAVLVEATDLREVQGRGQRSRQFSLVWRGPPGARLDQRIYTLRHAALGDLDLFLVSIGPDSEGMRYEAVFT